MSLSIKDFSEMSELSPQTLRFYHSEGLLVPAEVDEETGYRYYRFDQVETAMLVTALRGSGMSVKDVRVAVEAPDTAATLLEEQAEALRRQREVEDEAVATARELLTSWPEPWRRQVPHMTVLSGIVPPVAVAQIRNRPDQYDWEKVVAAVRATAEDLGSLAREHGASVSGPVWFTWARETPKQKERAQSLDGPHWLAKVPVVASGEVLATLAGKADVQEFEAGEELAVRVPGRLTMSKYATAEVRLATHIPEGYFPDAATKRYILHPDGTEAAARLRPLSEAADFT